MKSMNRMNILKLNMLPFLDYVGGPVHTFPDS